VHKIEDLFIDTGGVDDLDGPVPSKSSGQRRRRTTNNHERHIGSTLTWFRAALSAVGGYELAVAMYLYRLRKVTGSNTVALSNERLMDELGINRYAKYRALRKLEAAGLVSVRHPNKRTSQVTFSAKRGGRK
jgi:hypothetical protein